MTDGLAANRYVSLVNMYLIDVKCQDLCFRGCVVLKTTLSTKQMRFICFMSELVSASVVENFPRSRPIRCVALIELLIY